MMKKIFFITALLLCIAIVCNAQTATNARKVLDKTAAIVGSKNGATANFKISNKKLGTTRGTLSIKGNKFYAHTSKAIMWYNGKTQWSYLTSTNEVNISTPNPAQQMAMNPYTFINLYKSGYNLALKTIGADYQVHMKAQNAKQSIAEVYILINRSTYKPKQVKMKRGGEWTTITVSNFKNQKLADRIFTFQSKDFPTAEVVDLR